MNKSLEFKSIAPLSIGVDIGGTLTKISLLINKNVIKKNFNSEYDFIEPFELEQHYLYLKLIQTDSFKTEGIEFLKSKTE
jgi:hypothetical protein